MWAHWTKLISDTEQRTDTFLALQNRETGSPDFGSLTLEFGYPDPKPTLHFGASAISVYLCSDSRHHRNPAIPAAYEAALTYAETVQNHDGTFDYLPCNFQSPPDTAFIINRVVTTHDLIAKTREPGLVPLLPRIAALIEKAGRGMANGGFHTPNHRWALASCLSSVSRITGNSWFSNQAEAYLREGIDGNQDGEYAERSAGGYNKVNNDQMILLSQERQDPGYLAYVDRNLQMMLTYVDPDHSIFTNNSTRQDRGVKVFLEEYFSNYLLVGKALGKPLYLAVAKRILDDAILAGRMAPDCFDTILLHFGKLDYGDPLPPIPTSFEKLYKDSGIVRVGRGDWTFSLLQNAGRFLYFQAGKVTASLKLGVGFFERREFQATSLVHQGEVYVLTMEAKGWYYLPFPEAPPTNDWWAMDHKKRPLAPGPVLTFTITVKMRPEGDGIEVNIDVAGWEGVPLRFEIALTPGTEVDNDHFLVEGRPEEAILAKSGMVRVRRGTDVLAFGPAFADHRNIGGTYGSDTRSRDHFTAYCTGFSPLNRTLVFRRAPAREGLDP